MALFNWTDSYSVKISTVDIQHKKLVDMINSLHEAMTQGKGREVMSGLVNNLATYALRHFAEEEKYMTQHAYPDFTGHKAQHEAFKQKVGDFQKKLAEGKANVTLEVMTFLKDWLSKHILDVDKKYGPYLNEKGVH
ncbi:MAG: hemerythrin family protein [Candidatus Hydrogenedentes bacterium]|nr:hemerythrin family protein [Candidatus Hydrogenedentota bacterium]